MPWLLATRISKNRCIQRAADEEFDHLAWCEQRLRSSGEGRSVLTPVWYTGAFLIGAASGLLGDKWSLGFIAETESQVCDHLDSHLDRLPEEDARRLAGDRHADAGRRSRSTATMPARPVQPNFRCRSQLMKLTARVMTSTAYRV